MAVILNTSGLLDRSNLYFYILAFYVYQRDHMYMYIAEISKKNMYTILKVLMLQLLLKSQIKSTN